MITKEGVEKLYKEGFTYQMIGNQFGVSRQRIHQIMKGYSTQPGKKIKKELLKTIRLCEICHKRKKLEVHHLDKDIRNNDLSNLQAVCHQCHKLLEPGEPRQKNRLYPTARYAKDCKFCGKEMLLEGTVYISGIKTVCSKACGLKHRGTNVSCKKCGKNLRRTKSQLKGASYCSRKCFHGSGGGWASSNCVICGKEFIRRNQQINNEQATCSRKCGYIFRSANMKLR